MQYNVDKLGVTDLNVMQQEMLQIARRMRNIVLLSPTGSGKTLAYLLPIIEAMDENREAPQVLVLVPSRELAIQTMEVATKAGVGLRAVACYGGRPAMDEHRTMRGVRPHMIIGTPGRILDHLTKENFDASSLTTLVIDEFDKSLELGFQQQMHDVLDRLPALQRRILLSATDNPEIPSFVGAESLHRVSYLDDDQVPDRITLKQLRSPEKDKLGTLFRLLCHLGERKSLVFVNYRESVARVADYLAKMGVAADSFHGGMEQKDRERALFRFSNGSCNVFVSTDLAARGLDISDIDCIIHYHLPLNEDAYIHRNGRTARWDGVGEAVMLLGPEEHLPEYITQADDIEDVRLPQHLPSPARPRWTTLYVGKGKKNKISKGDVMGFLSKTGGLTREQVGRIDVMSDWSYVAVETRCVKSLLPRLQGQKIKGVKTLFSVAR